MRQIRGCAAARVRGTSVLLLGRSPPVWPSNRGRSPVRSARARRPRPLEVIRAPRGDGPDLWTLSRSDRTGGLFGHGVASGIRPVIVRAAGPGGWRWHFICGGCEPLASARPSLVVLVTAVFPRGPCDALLLRALGPLRRSRCPLGGWRGAVSGCPPGAIAVGQPVGDRHGCRGGRCVSARAAFRPRDTHPGIGDPHHARDRGPRIAPRAGHPGRALDQHPPSTACASTRAHHHARPVTNSHRPDPGHHRLGPRSGADP